jgi:hypothetical protein
LFLEKHIGGLERWPTATFSPRRHEIFLCYYPDESWGGCIEQRAMRIPTVFESVWSLDIGIWRSLVSSSFLAYVIVIIEFPGISEQILSL